MSTKWIVQAQTTLRVIDMMKKRLQTNPILLQLPLGVEDQFRGVIDLISMKLITFDEDSMGTKFEISEIPGDVRDEAFDARQRATRVCL